MKKSIGPENQRKTLNSGILDIVVKMFNSYSLKYKKIDVGIRLCLIIFFLIFLFKPCVITFYMLSAILMLWILGIGIGALIVFLNWNKAEKIRKSLKLF